MKRVGEKGVFFIVLFLLIAALLPVVYADSIDNIISQAIANPVPAEQISQESVLQSQDQIQQTSTQELTQQSQEESKEEQGIVVDTAVAGEVESLKSADAEIAAKNKAVEKKGLKKYFSDREKANKANEKVKATKIAAKKVAAEAAKKAEEAAKASKTAAKTSTKTKIKTATNKATTKVKTAVKATGKAISDFFYSFSLGISGFTGRVIKSYEYEHLELPANPIAPGAVEEVVKPKWSFAKIFRFLTGYAIIGVPEWSYDGSQSGNYLWEVEYTAPAAGMQHFELDLRVNMTDSVNGIVYSKGYYLDEKAGEWKDFEFTGTSVGSTGWLREEAAASMTLNNFTDKDYAIFLAYSCSKKMGQEWDCNQGKWVIFVVETGDISYNQDIGEVPEMQYTEVQNLNITDIPSILNQLGISAFDFQPVMHDALLISPKTDFETQVNQVEKFEFYIKNIGNRQLTNLTFELDIGEQALAEVVAAEIPDKIEMNETIKGSVSLLFKEAGNWNFLLFLKPKQEEVDTSDNILRFSVNVSGETLPNIPQDSLTDAWNRKINYTVKEEYSRQEYAQNSSLVVISGTDKMRTVFGGYYQGRSINPTMEVSLEPKVTEEALFSTPYVASIKIGGKMLTGDRETVEYYVVLKNEKTGKIYTTPKMESMYAYYYNPKELISDFEFCTDYSAKVVLVGRTSETIDVIQPQGFNLCDFSKNIGPLVRTKRLLKLDGNYIAVSFNLNEKYFEPGQIISYQVEFTDRYNQKHITRIINSSEGVVLLKLGEVISRAIDFYTGETLGGRVILLNSIVTRQGSIKFGKLDGNIHFVWNNWSITASLGTSLLLKDEKIHTYDNTRVFAASSIEFQQPWKTHLISYYSIQYPGYFDLSVRNKVQSETEYSFSIRDLNENREIYNVKIDCSKAAANPPAYNSPNYQKDLYIWYFCSGGMFISYLQEIEPLPEFISGHYYDFSLKIISDNADLYAPIKPVKILYIDGYQFIANNPLLRTRFLYLDNHPKFLSVDSSKFDAIQYVPTISIEYMPKNLFFNETSNRVDFIDTSQREIKLSELISVSGNTDGRYDYQQIPGKAKPLLDRTFISITPLSNTFQMKRNQFNCKLGRYDLICRRDGYGYNVIYVDELNNLIYTIQLGYYDSLFVKKYRDNPQAYDAVIYDILSEIDRNPIQSLIPTHTIEKRFPDVRLITFGSQGRFSNSNNIFTSDAYRGYNETQAFEINCVYNKTFHDIYGDYPVLAGFRYVGSAVPNNRVCQDYSLSVFRRGALVYSKNIGKNVCSSPEDFSKALSRLANSINLTNNEVYGFELAPENKTAEIYSFAYTFKYKKDYEKEVVEDNSNYIRKILGINSTVLGPYDFIYAPPSFPCAAKAYSNLTLRFLFSSPEGSPYGVNPILSQWSNYDSFSAVFSVNPPAVKNFYSGEETGLEEFRNNTRGERRFLLDSNRFYSFSVLKFYDLYSYYQSAPIDYTQYNTPLTNLSCFSYTDSLTSSPGASASSFTLRCKFANINDLKVYQVGISQIFPGKTVADLSNLDTATLQDFNNYAEIVLRKYLEWYPPTPLLNTNFNLI